MKHKSFLIGAMLTVGALNMMAQSGIQFKTYNKTSYYLTKTLVESVWDESMVYGGFEFNTQLMWPVSGLPANKLHTLRECILRSYASENVTRAMISKVDDTEFFNSMHSSMLKEYLVDGACSEGPQELRYVAPTKLPKNTSLSSAEQDMKLKRAKNGVYVLYFHVQEYCMGAAHPMYGEYALNYDVVGNRQLKLRDIFDPNQTAEINRTYRALVNKINDEFKESVNLNDASGWYISDAGIVFLFQPYEIASFADGVVEIILPVKKYKRFFRPEVLKFWGL